MTDGKYEKELISVIIPVYNVEKYLDRCMESVLNQTYRNLEIILVDDGSTDNSGKMCDEYAKRDSRVRVIHQQNKGLSSARNIGIDISEGVYISFIDSDDWVALDYIEYLCKILVESQADLAVCNYIETSSAQREIFDDRECRNKILSGRDFLLKVLKVGTQENVQYAWGKLYRNFKNTDIRYPVGLIDEDVPTTFKYGTICSKVVLTDKILYAYYENRDSILRKEFNRKRFDLLKVWKIIVDYANVKCDSEIARYALVNYYRANFGILCNICTEKVKLQDKDYVKEHEKQALYVVKKHKKELLSFNMPLSRKILVVGFTYAYPLNKFLIKLLNYNKIYKMKG